MTIFCLTNSQHKKLTDVLTFFLSFDQLRGLPRVPLLPLAFDNTQP